jgi:protein TonB
MFAELCDSNWENRLHRGWTTLASFSAQALAVGALFIVPLIYPQGLEQFTAFARSSVLAPPPAPTRPASTRAAPPAPSNLLSDGRIIEPSSVPPAIERLDEQSAPPPVDLAGIGVAHATGDARGSNSVIDGLGSAPGIVLPPPSPAVHRPPLSHMMEGNLIFRVQPGYPDLAKRARIQGQVMLRAIISREGTIENLQVISGHPMLVQAAMKAVQQWRYRPYVLNGEPVEVETQVTVNFVLSGG